LQDGGVGITQFPMHQKSRHSLHPPPAYQIHTGYQTQQNGGVRIAQFSMHQQKTVLRCNTVFLVNLSGSIT